MQVDNPIAMTSLPTDLADRWQSLVGAQADKGKLVGLAAAKLLPPAGPGPHDYRPLAFTPGEGGALLGQYRYLSLRPFRHRASSGRDVLCLRVGLYRARVAEDGLTIGGPAGCSQAWDLRLAPTETRTLKSFRLGDDDEFLAQALSLYQELQGASEVQEAQAIVPEMAEEAKATPGLLTTLPLPQCWLGFSYDRLPVPQDTPAVRAAALAYLASSDAVFPGETVRPDRSAKVLEVQRHADHVSVRLSAQGERPFSVAMPVSAVLDPAVRPGVTVSPGASLGHAVPRDRYSGWAAVQAVAGQAGVNWLLSQTALLEDRPVGDTVWRRFDFAPRCWREATAVFEDPAPCLGWCPDGDGPAPKTFPLRNASALQSYSSGVRVDLLSVREEWGDRYAPARRRR